MAQAIRLTFSTSMVLQALGAGYRYGFDIMDVSGLPDGTVYPALRRLEGAGWVTSEWEDTGEAHQRGRPARRNYSLTPLGRQRLHDARQRFPGIVAAVSVAQQPHPGT